MGCQKSSPTNTLWISARAASSVIARSPCDEAIQTVSVDTSLDCFASLAMTSRGGRSISYSAKCLVPAALTSSARPPRRSQPAAGRW
ncbi:hypothetical protein C7U93_09055 [Bradyrhizobium sp. WBOS8]|nr:hypothetical protein [Bradyrhizobium sp. WBOS8]